MENKTIHPLAARVFEIDDAKKEPIDLSDYGIEKGSMFAHTIPSLVSQKITRKCSVLKPGVSLKDSKPEDWEMSDDYSYLMIVASIKDPSGNQVFEKEHIEQLQEKSQGVVAKLYEAVNKVNGITEKDIDTAEKK